MPVKVRIEIIGLVHFIFSCDYLLHHPLMFIQIILQV